MLAFDSGPPLRSEGLVEEEQRSLPTLARLSDWKASLETSACLSDRGYTKPLFIALLRLAQSKPTRTNRPGTLAR